MEAGGQGWLGLAPCKGLLFVVDPGERPASFAGAVFPLVLRTDAYVHDGRRYVQRLCDARWGEGSDGESLPAGIARLARCVHGTEGGCLWCEDLVERESSLVRFYAAVARAAGEPFDP